LFFLNFIRNLPHQIILIHNVKNPVNFNTPNSIKIFLKSFVFSRCEAYTDFTLEVALQNVSGYRNLVNYANRQGSRGKTLHLKSNYQMSTEWTLAALLICCAVMLSLNRDISSFFFFFTNKPDWFAFTFLILLQFSFIFGGILHFTIKIRMKM
jgi:hypothetical protein